MRRPRNSSPRCSTGRRRNFSDCAASLNQALRAGDRSTALGIAHRATTLRPSTPWVVESLFDLEAREGRWQAAEKTLAQAVKRRIIPRERARHHRGVILYELSLAALAGGDRRQGVNLGGAGAGADAGSRRPGGPSRQADACRTGGPDRRQRRSNAPGGPRRIRSWRRFMARSMRVETPLARFKSFETAGGAKPRRARKPSRFGGSGARRAAVGRSAAPPRGSADRRRTALSPGRRNSGSLLRQRLARR